MGVAAYGAFVPFGVIVGVAGFLVEVISMVGSIIPVIVACGAKGTVLLADTDGIGTTDGLAGWQADNSRTATQNMIKTLGTLAVYHKNLQGGLY